MRFFILGVLVCLFLLVAMIILPMLIPVFHFLATILAWILTAVFIVWVGCWCLYHIGRAVDYIIEQLKWERDADDDNSGTEA